MESFLYDTNYENIKLLSINNKNKQDFIINSKNYHILFNIEYDIFHNVDLINLFLELFNFLKQQENINIFITISCLNNEEYTTIIYKKKIDNEFNLSYNDFVKLINDNLFNKLINFEESLQICNDEKLIHIFIGNVSNKELTNKLHNYIVENNNIYYSEYFDNNYIGYGMNHNNYLLFDFTNNNNFNYYNTNNNLHNLKKSVYTIIEKKVFNYQLTINCNNCTIYNFKTNSYQDNLLLSLNDLNNYVFYLKINKDYEDDYNVSLNINQYTIQPSKFNLEDKEEEINNMINELNQNLTDFYKSLGKKRINEINNTIKKLEIQKNNLLETNETYYAKQIYIIRLHILEIMYNTLQYIYSKNLDFHFDFEKNRNNIYKFVTQLEDLKKYKNKFNFLNYIDLLINSLLISYRSLTSFNCKILLVSYFYALGQQHNFINDNTQYDVNSLKVVSIKNENEINNILFNKKINLNSHFNICYKSLF